MAEPPEHRDVAVTEKSPRSIAMSKILVAILLGACATARAADTYSIDPNHTHATFAFQHLGFSTFQGKVPARSGTIVLDRAQQRGSAEIVFDLQNVTTGVAKFDEHLRSKDFFDVAQHPTASFKATRMSFAGDAPTLVTGDLTI